MEHFANTITYRLDAKGRVSLPAKFRQVLSEHGADTIFIIQSPSLSALEAFGPGLRAELNARLSVFDPFSEDYDAFAQTFFGSSVELAWDTEGRIKLPDHFLSYAKITDEAVFVGLGRKFQIWDPASFEIQRRHMREVAHEKRGLLDLRGTAGHKP